MAGIPLREYIREIEKQVDGKRYEEAIAHCHHILISYPKHVDVYRLLGKAFLESQRYGDAADIFQRVLSAIPDDFVSHAGMSIIREDEGNMDEAIWHMERAFDVQPSNSAIQEELRRMYERRDNVEPPKIRLSRSALARMYYRGELYPQAIAETRAALAENPDRLDLQALLAEIYSKAGQRAEAVEVANQILRRLPYCLVANRVLFEALSASDQTSEAATYHQRLCQLNPYYSFVADASTAVENVPDSAVRLDKLEWKVGQGPAGKAGQPIWAATLGVDLGDAGGAKEEPLPEWLSSSSDVSQSGFEPGEVTSIPAFSLEESAAITGEPDLDLTAPTEEDQLPDWMKDLGWTPASGVSHEAEAELAFTDEVEAPPTEGELAEAELPEWFKEIAPQAIETPLTEEQQAPWVEESAAEDEDLAPWLDKLFAGGTAPEEETPIAELEEAPFETPAVDNVSVTLDETVSPVEAPEIAAAEAPEEPIAAVAPSVEPAEEELPEWLFVGDETTAQAQAEPAAPAEEELPSWLEEELLSEETSETAQQTAEEEELPSWLFKSEVEEETTAQAEQTLTELPEWLLEEEEAPAEIPAAEEQIEWRAEGQPLLDEETAEMETNLEAVELPDWLKAELGPEEKVEAEAPTAEIPDWLLESSQEEAMAETEETIEEAGGWLSEIETAAQDVTRQSEETERAAEIPTWLVEEEPSTQEAPATEIPDWLKAVETSASTADLSSEWFGEQPAPETEETELEQAELPEWLLEMQAADAVLDQQALTEAGEEGKPEAEPETEQQPLAETPSVAEIGETQPTPATPEIAPEEAGIVDKEMEEALAWLNLMLSPQTPPPAAPPEEAKPVSSVEQSPAAGISDDEAAFAWLESLAVRQGAQEALLLSPEERQETPPEWVLQDLERGESEAPTAALEEPLALEPEKATQEEERETVEAETAQPAVTLSDEDAAFAWLESLAVRQGAQEALLLSPEERLETPPDWVVEQQTPPPETAPETIEKIAEEIALPTEQIAEGEATAEVETVMETTTPETAAPMGETPIAEAPSVSPVEEVLPELPDWLVEPGVETREEQLEWTPPPITRRKYDLNLATLVELERLPGVGFIMAQQIIEYREQHGPFQQVDDLLKVPNFTPYTLEGIRDYLFVAAAPQPLVVSAEPKAPDTGPVILAEGAGVPDEILKARELLGRNELELALAAYSRLIERGDHLNWVIDDLGQAAAQFPSQISILQNLGDAYLRANQLAEALRAYTQAEKLLA